MHKMYLHEASQTLKARTGKSQGIPLNGLMETQDYTASQQRHPNNFTQRATVYSLPWDLTSKTDACQQHNGEKIVVLTSISVR